MRKILFIIGASIVLYACSKENTPSQPPPPPVDYSAFKLKTAVHSRASYLGTSSEYSSDTTSYTYSGTTCNYVTRHSTGRVYNYTLALNNGIYSHEVLVGGVLSPSKTYYKLNKSGYIDSIWVTINSATTQTSRYTYNTDGTRAMEVSNYSSYKNINRYYYQNGVAVYSLFERISNSPSIPNASDSIAYEYAAEFPFRADFYTMGLPASVFGKPAGNLLKKTTHYNKLNGNAIRQTAEYTYQTNEIGLITRKVFSMYTQPGNVLGLTDTTVYAYYDK